MMLFLSNASCVAFVFTSDDDLYRVSYDEDFPSALQYNLLSNFV